MEEGGHANDRIIAVMTSGARIVEWAHLTARAHAALDLATTVVVVTCSPLEVHGPHLPLLADVGEAEGLFGRALARMAERDPRLTFVRLPPVWVATDVVPQRGSVRFRPATVVRVLEDLGTSVARQGLGDIWVGNFHGGPRHILAIEEACARVQRRTGARMISVFSLLARRLTGGSSDLAERLGGLGGISTEELRGDAHGGLIETAMLLHLFGGDVDPAYRTLPPRSIEILLAERGRPPLQKGPRPTVLELLRALPYKLRYFETETYAGAPAKATPELGRQYLEVLAGEAAQALGELRAVAIGPRDCHSPLWPYRHLLMSRPLGWLFEKLVATRPSPV